MTTKSIIPEEYQKMLSRVLPVLVFLLGIWYFCIRILGYGFEFLPGDMGDSRFINFLLEHGYQWSMGNTDSFWSAGFMYPFENVVALSDNMIGTMPFYGVWRLLGFSHETSYQLWWIVICSLNYWSAYYVMKRWFNRWDLAIIAAWIFAFTIFNLGQINYMQMMIRFMVPIVLYSGVKMVDTSRVKYLVIFSLGIVYQFYGVIYNGFFLMYFSLFLVVAYAIITKKYLFFVPFFKKQALLFTGATLLISVLAMLWLMQPYIDMSEQLGMRTYDEVRWNVPVILSFFFASESAYTWQILNESCKPDVPIWWIHYAFPGMIPLIGMLGIPFFWIYWKIRKSDISKLTWAVSIVVFIVFMGFIRTYDGQTFFALFFKLPGMGSMRVLNRFINVELFLILILLISLAVKVPRKWSILLFILVVLDNAFVPSRVIREDKAMISDRRESMIELIEENRNDEHIAYVVIDSTQTEFFKTHLDAMIASTYVPLPTVNGYSSGCPGEFGQFFTEVSEAGLTRWYKDSGLDSTKVLVIQK